MDFNAIKERAGFYKEDMTKLLRDLVTIPGESCNEKGKVERAAEEMRKLGFNKVEIDGMGNLLGYMGTDDNIAGKTLIAFDGHIDNVGVGNLNNWNFDPFDGMKTTRK